MNRINQNSSKILSQLSTSSIRENPRKITDSKTFTYRGEACQKAQWTNLSNNRSIA